MHTWPRSQVRRFSSTWVASSHILPCEAKWVQERKRRPSRFRPTLVSWWDKSEYSRDDIRIEWSRATVPTEINIKKESSGPQMLIAQSAFLPWSHHLAPVSPIRQPREHTCARSSHWNNDRPASACDWSPNLRLSPLRERGPLTSSTASTSRTPAGLQPQCPETGCETNTHQ